MCLVELSKIITEIDLMEQESIVQHTRSTLGAQTRRNYTIIEIVYIITLTLFGIVFVYDIPMAIQLEYSVLLCVLALAIINAITFHLTCDYVCRYQETYMYNTTKQTNSESMGS